MGRASCRGSTVLDKSGVVGWIETMVVARLEDERSDMRWLVCKVAVETRQGFIHTFIVVLLLIVNSRLVSSCSCSGLRKI